MQRYFSRRRTEIPTFLSYPLILPHDFSRSGVESLRGGEGKRRWIEWSLNRFNFNLSCSKNESRNLDRIIITCNAMLCYIMRFPYGKINIYNQDPFLQKSLSFIELLYFHPSMINLTPILG